jgi:hypothetical protein
MIIASDFHLRKPPRALPAPAGGAPRCTTAGRAVDISL